MLKEQPDLYRMIELSTAQMDYLGLRLRGRVALTHHQISQFVEIGCFKAIDYSIRPPNPAILMGGPLMEFHEEHPSLQAVSRSVPNTDGLETFDPSVKFGLLVIDQSYVIAQRFDLFLEIDDIFKRRQTRQL